jgi:hypothetical protein
MNIYIILYYINYNCIILSGWTITERELPKPKIGDEKKEDEK